MNGEVLVLNMPMQSPLHDPDAQLVVMADDGEGNIVPAPKWSDKDMEDASNDWYGEEVEG